VTTEADRCPECGSWDAQCASETPIKGCGCSRCLTYAYRNLTYAYRKLRLALQEFVDYERQRHPLKMGGPEYPPSLQPLMERAASVLDSTGTERDD
jgi:hypothetical protein